MLRGCERVARHKKRSDKLRKKIKLMEKEKRKMLAALPKEVTAGSEQVNVPTEVEIQEQEPSSPNGSLAQTMIIDSVVADINKEISPFAS